MPSSLSTCYEQMVNRCTQVQTGTHNTGTHGTCNSGTERYLRYRYSWRLPQSPMVPPHCRHQLPKHSICPARRHHYGTNMVTIIILPLSPSIYYLTRHIGVGATYSEQSPKSASYISHPRPSNSYSCRSSSTLVRGFRVGPTPVIRKIVGREEKEGGYKKWPISWLALN